MFNFTSLPIRATKLQPQFAAFNHVSQDFSQPPFWLKKWPSEFEGRIVFRAGYLKVELALGLRPKFRSGAKDAAHLKSNTNDSAS